MITPPQKIFIIKGLSAIVLTSVFVAIIYFVIKAMKRNCDSGYHWSETRKRCEPTCSTGEKYYKTPNKCLKCPPGQVNDKDYGCIDNCSIKGDDWDLCGGQCYNKKQDSCVKDKICNTSQVTWTGTCCSEGETYKVGKPVFTVTGSDTVNVIAGYLYKYTNTPTTKVKDVFTKNNINSGIDLLRLGNSEWESLGFDINTAIVLRTACGLPVCSACVVGKCGDGCCTETQTCIPGDTDGAYKCCDEIPSTTPDGRVVCCPEGKWAEKDEVCCPDEADITVVDGVCSNKCKYPDGDGNTVSCAYNGNMECLDLTNTKINGASRPAMNISKCIKKSDSLCVIEDAGESPNSIGSVILAKRIGGGESTPLLYDGRSSVSYDYIVENKFTTSAGTTCGVDDCWKRARDLNLDGVINITQTTNSNNSKTCIVKRAVNTNKKFLSQTANTQIAKTSSDQFCKTSSDHKKGTICPHGSNCVNDTCIAGWGWNGKTDSDFRCQTYTNKKDIPGDHTSYDTKDSCIANTCSKGKCCAPSYTWDATANHCLEQVASNCKGVTIPWLSPDGGGTWCVRPQFGEGDYKKWPRSLYEGKSSAGAKHCRHLYYTNDDHPTGSRPWRNTFRSQRWNDPKLYKSAYITDRMKKGNVHVSHTPFAAHPDHIEKTCI